MRTTAGKNATIQRMLDAGMDIGLFTTGIADDGTGTEVTGGGYTRQSFPGGTPVDGVSSNTTTVTFTCPAGDVLALGFYVDGVLESWDWLQRPLTVPVGGGMVEFEAGTIDYVVKK